MGVPFSNDKRSRVGFNWFPKHVIGHPPMYERAFGACPAEPEEFRKLGEVAMITCGRYGALNDFIYTSNPSDSAIVAMLDSARKSIRLSLQDLGPLTMPLEGYDEEALQAIPG